MKLNYKEGLNILKKGGILIFPTDTAFGIGCRIDDEKAVLRLYKIRKRPENMPFPMLFDSISMVERYAYIEDAKVRELLRKYWPGGLTVVLKSKQDKIPAEVLGGGDSVGVRIPNDRRLIRMIGELGVPIIGTSANFHGQITPFNASDLDKDLIKLSDGVLEGSAKGKVTSTVIDTTKTPWKILRLGGVRLNL